MNTKHARSSSRSGAAGFTLVELLVVIAIIGILAGIVVPNVAQYLLRGQTARAVSEIRNADTSLAAMLSDAGKSRFSHFLTPAMQETVRNFSDPIAAESFYTNFFYELLRQGKNTDLPYLDPEVRSKLGNSYMNIGLDPWGNRYRFWMGPQRTGVVIHRSYRVKADNATYPEEYYVYNDYERNLATQKIPGQPAADNFEGFPAPRDMPAYIYSAGPNELYDSMIAIGRIYNDPLFLGGGDDPNNWDNQAGWNDAPK